MSVDSLQELGVLFRAFREHRGWSQSKLADEAGGVPRTAVAHLEQGLRLPAVQHLRALVVACGIPEALIDGFLHPRAHLRVNFEAELGELIGQPISISRLDRQATHAVEDAIESLVGADVTNQQAFDTLREILVFYGLRPVSREFFDAYFKADSFQSVERFGASVRRYQEDAIRLFPTFSQAFDVMNRESGMGAILAPLRSRSLDPFTERAPWNRVEEIEETRLRDLGYIAAAKLDKERLERLALVGWLREMAGYLRSRGRAAIEEFKPKRRREMESLLRKFGSSLPHGPLSPLFGPTPEELEAEAERLAPKEETDRARIAETQEQGLRNLSQYLAADHMDVYVATSMRDDSDFVSVNRFVQSLFLHPDVKSLKLRYFNPTQSWIEDRIAKGLVEALMLRRSSATIYMAQKSDTFGKDSEASVALGQGKPVIVYVPRLLVPDVGLDSSEIGRLSDEELQRRLQEIDPEEVSESMDHEALLGAVLNSLLSKASDEAIAGAVAQHWADFGLDSVEARQRIREDLRGDYIEWIRRIAVAGRDDIPRLPSGLRAGIQSSLLANALIFERRATLFREKHPLALQVILSTGVLNGILVVRSVESCARLLRQVFANELDLELVRGEGSYRLIERTTGSTIRVISRYRLLGNAFASYYG